MFMEKDLRKVALDFLSWKKLKKQQQKKYPALQGI